jgi:hypothetical protein
MTTVKEPSKPPQYLIGIEQPHTKTIDLKQNKVVRRAAPLVTPPVERATF